MQRMVFGSNKSWMWLIVLWLLLIQKENSGMEWFLLGDGIV